ncbi:MAG: hypothetical protein ACMXX8_02035 [Candidatus Woesearchaeota archaeon]
MYEKIKLYHELLKSNIKNLKYWQNKKKQEVDIIDNVSEQIAIKIKYKEKLIVINFTNRISK